MLQNVRHLPLALPSPAMPASKSSYDLPLLIGVRPKACNWSGFGSTLCGSGFHQNKGKQQGLPRRRDIRRTIINADLVDTACANSACLQSEATPQLLSEAKNIMVALPGQLSYNTPIAACLWFLAKNKNADAKFGFRDRRKQTLFIDTRKLGSLALSAKKAVITSPRYQGTDNGSNANQLFNIITTANECDNL
jgi:hypothetical protein